MTESELSTSAQLAETQAAYQRTQAALAASQAALTAADDALALERRKVTDLGEALRRMRAERDKEGHAAVQLNALHRDACDEVALVRAELASAREELELLRSERPPLPVTVDEIRAWYADHGLAYSCGPAVLFSALRRYLNQDETDPAPDNQT